MATASAASYSSVDRHDDSSSRPNFGMPKGSRVNPGQVLWQGRYVDQAQFYRELVAASPNQRNWKGITIAICVILLILASVAVSVVILTPPEEEPRVKGHKFGIEHILDRKYLPRRYNGSWISDNELVFLDSTGGLSILALDTFNSTQIVSNTTFRRYNVVQYSLSPNRLFVLLTHKRVKRYRYSSFAQYSVYEISTGLVWDVSSRGDLEEEVILREGSSSKLEKPSLLYATWMRSSNPAEDAILFVENYTIYYIPDVGARTKKVYPISQTDTVVPDIVIHGVPDWIYEEDILKRDNAIWVSPSGQQLVYATFNDTDVQTVRWKVYGDGSDASVDPYPKEGYMRYPKAGTTNPTFTLWYVDLSDLNNLQYQELRTPLLFREIDYYFTAISWAKSDSVAVIWMNRAQNISLVTECNSPTWVCRETYREEMEKSGWSTLYSAPVYSKSGDSFLLLAPLKDGDYGNYAHIALIETAHTHLIHPLTFGHFEVEKILAWDEEEGIVYFQGIPEENPSERHVFSASDNWKAGPQIPKCLTCNLPSEIDKDCNFNRAHFSPTNLYYVLECRGPDVPSTYLLDVSGPNQTLTVVLDDNESAMKMAATMAWPNMETVLIPLPDTDRQLRAKFYYPPQLRKDEFIRFPLVLHVYSGPGSQLVVDEWKLDFNTFMASGKGYIVLEVDGRGSGGQGEAHKTKIKHRLGQVEVQDQLAALEYVKSLQFVDSRRIAVTGVSYGGYVSAMMLATSKPETLACAVSVSPVVDWRFYESAYTERYMGLPLPTENFHGYQLSSLIDRCEGMRGKEFFLAHGMADRNVHFQNSMILAKTLVGHNIAFEQHFYPDEDHFLDGVKVHLYESVTRFIANCFGKFEVFTDEEQEEEYYDS